MTTVGTMTGALVVTGALVTTLVGSVVGSAVGELVVEMGDTDGVSGAATVGGFTTGVIVLVVVGIVGVVGVFGMVDADGGTLLDVVADNVPARPLQFPVPQ